MSTADYSSAELTNDEKTWAMLAHLSLFAGMVLPTSQLIIPLVVYFVWQGSSRFVGFHALQALLGRLMIASLMVFTLVITIAVALALGLTVGAASDEAAAGFAAGFFGWILLWIICCAALGILDVGMAIYLAVTSGQGQWSEYWPIGGIIKGWLPAGPPPGQQAMGYGTGAN